jgi:hypothetical protein
MDRIEMLYDNIEMLYDNMDRFDKEQMADYLMKDGYPTPYSHPAEFKFQNGILKLYDKWNMLTQEEEETILKIANRF